MTEEYQLNELNMINAERGVNLLALRYLIAEASERAMEQGRELHHAIATKLDDALIEYGGEEEYPEFYEAMKGYMRQYLASILTTPSGR